MAVFSMAVVVISKVHTLEFLNAVTGVEATGWKGMGERISTYSQRDKVHRDSVWTFRAQSAEGRPVDEFMSELRPVLERIRSHGPLDEADVKLSIGTFAAGSGYSFNLEAEDLRAVADAGAYVWIDSYTETTGLRLLVENVRGGLYQLSGQRRRHRKIREARARFFE